MNSFITKNKVFLFLPVLMFIGMMGITGCDDSGVATEEGTTTDTNVVIYKDVAAYYWQNGSNDTSYMGINLLEGDSTRQVSTLKDMELIDSVNTFHNFYFRSGDMSLIAIGFKTRFSRPYRDISSDKFDTLSVIPDSDTLGLTPSDFTSDDTYGNTAWGYFNFSQTEQPVYGFYLQGRNTGNKYIYGVFHVKSIDQVSSNNPPSAGIKITVDIKLNKAGNNHFVVQ